MDTLIEFHGFSALGGPALKKHDLGPLRLRALLLFSLAFGLSRAVHTNSTDGTTVQSGEAGCTGRVRARKVLNVGRAFEADGTPTASLRVWRFGIGEWCVCAVDCLCTARGGAMASRVAPADAARRAGS